MTEKQDALYVVGDGERERQRLQEQATFVNSFTRRLFEEAGIAPGMRVLDVGSGMGDVALLAAEMVGTTGAVVGVDKNPDVIEAARGRMPANVSLHVGDIRTVALDGEFDAIVGRLVLMYLQDPTVAVTHAVGRLRSGGVVAFLEPDLTTGGGVGIPHSPLNQQLWEWLTETFRRAGVETHMGFKLRRTLLDAGLTSPQLQANSIIGGGPGWGGYRYYEETLRSMLPAMEALGVATAAEVDIDTLAVRLEAEAVQLDSTLMFSTWIGAWARKR
ncbi:MAG: methyltransferase domain-containing protein [Caldilineaceae bacterium]|nr:methyltransferase domain-containing protein [Caldilineaceae bacterium]